MLWPLPSDYAKILGNPEIAFRDPQLQQCRIRKRPGGKLPQCWSGNRAVVFQGTLADGRTCFALRAFLGDQAGRQERYRAISDYLQKRRPQCLVDFEYQHEGIRVGDRKWYPLVKMQWVPGVTLLEWAVNQVQARDTQALSEASERWAHLIQDLADAWIVHADLQHRNVMVTETAELKLVDYDCLGVPALMDQPTPEDGLEPYQIKARLPDRQVLTLCPELDRFAALGVYVALRALAVAPELRARHVTKSDSDILLFQATDFDAPGQSPLLQDLQDRSAELGQMIHQLAEFYRGNLSAVPRLEEFRRRELKAPAVAPVPWSPPGGVEPEKPGEPLSLPGSPSPVPDVRKFRVTYRQGRLLADWDWPPEVTSALMIHRLGSPPVGPDDRQRGVVAESCDKSYVNLHGPPDFRPSSQIGQQYVVVYARQATAGRTWRYSHGVTCPIPLNLCRRLRSAIREVSKRGGEYELTLTPEADVILPELVLAAKRDKLPEHDRDGSRLCRIPEGTSCAPNAPLVRPFRLPSLDCRWGLGLFLTDHALYAWLDLTSDPPEGLWLP